LSLSLHAHTMTLLSFPSRRSSDLILENGVLPVLALRRVVMKIKARLSETALRLYGASAAARLISVMKTSSASISLCLKKGFSDFCPLKKYGLQIDRQ